MFHLRHHLKFSVSALAAVLATAAFGASGAAGSTTLTASAKIRSCVRISGELNLASRVRFLGWKADPTAAYAAADLAIHASTSEALSNFLIEAQGSGLPCIAYKAQGNGECIIDGKTGHIIPQGNREAFCEAITSLSGEHEDVRRQRSARARAHARDNFDEVKQIDAYLNLFLKLLEEKASQDLQT